MSGKKKDKKHEKNEDKHEETSEPTTSLENKTKKTKNLRFQLPEFSPSEESFISASSYTAISENEDLQSAESIFKKFTPVPLYHTFPREALPKPCFSAHLTEAGIIEPENNIYLSIASSSRQIFEILRHSPTPSDADINLINATYLRKLDEVKDAIKNGADVNTYRDRQTPILIATEIGDNRLVAYLLTVPNINPDFQNIFGQTPLLIAVRNCFDKIVKLLLNHNAGVNIPDNLGKTPLHSALYQQRPHMAKLLLAYGADYEKEDCFGEGPMYTSAVRKPSLDCLKLLLKVGASVEYVNVTGIPLLSRAIMNWTEFKIIETLVRFGASVNSTDLNSKKSPLHFAAIINDVRVAKFLVNMGADTNAKTVYNFTPFDEAIFHRSLDVAEYLVDMTTNVNKKRLKTLQAHQTS